MKPRTDAERERFVLALYDQYYADLKRLLFHFAAYDRQFLPDIEECIQDTMAAAYDAYDRLLEHPNVKGWLYKACAYRMNTRLKKERKAQSARQPLDSAEFELSHDAVEAWVKREDDGDSARALLSRLKPGERQLLMDAYEEHKPLAVIARERGTSEGTIKVQLHRIRKKLREAAKNVLTFLLQIIFIQ